MRMKQCLSLVLAMVLLCTLGTPALASFALGEDLTQSDVLLHEQTQLSSNVFWSTTYSDLRQEHLITYTPNPDVTPVVTFGSTLTERSTVSAAASALEQQGHRVVAGINGDFYDTSNGLPIGIVVTEGQLDSSDGGLYAIGFQADGSMIIGKPQVTIEANLGYTNTDETGYVSEEVRHIFGVNKARSSTGGAYLYTYDFNSKHTTGNTEPGVDVICSIKEGQLAIGETLTLTVEQIIEATGPTPIGEHQMVLSVNLKSDSYHVEGLRKIPVGTDITINATAANPVWNDTEYAVGALHSLVENGQVVSGLEAGAAPRTAVGLKADGTAVFYTIDGRQPGYSIGATLSQVAARLVELGCVTAVGLDGGGSTTLSVTEPDALTADAINQPSDGSQRAVSNHIFLVASSEASNELSHFYVKADKTYVLAGSEVHISATGIDTNYIPMEADYKLSASHGELLDTTLVTPAHDAEITVTAEDGDISGSTTVYAIETPDQLYIRNASGVTLNSLTLSPGSETALTAAAVYQYLPLAADPDCFRWSVTEGLGSISDDGVFTAEGVGSGFITVTAGERSVSIPLTVSKPASETLESFESSQTIFSNGSGSGIRWSHIKAGDQVRMGYGAAQLHYTLAEEDEVLAARWDLEEAVTASSIGSDTVSLWVYGDNSDNALSLLFRDRDGVEQVGFLTLLNFNGWVKCTAVLGNGFALTGLQVTSTKTAMTEDDFGNLTLTYPNAVIDGVICLDQLAALSGGVSDDTVPQISLNAKGTSLTAQISDETDGLLKQSGISVTYDGAPLSYDYSAGTGTVTAALPAYDGLSHRITVTAQDASGNIGRASYDIPADESYVSVFTDTQDYWGAAYVDYLYRAGITTGYSDSTFRPNQNITRAQFAVMLYRYLGLEESRYENVELPFADTDAIGAYAIPAVKALYTEGMINGSTGSDGQLYFNPNSSLTRAQAAAMIGRTQQKGYAAAPLAFTDAANIPSYAQFYVQTMTAQGVIGGYQDGTFRPNHPITRGQMAKILYHLQ